MIRIENECVDCPKDIGCIGNACQYLKVPRYYCDCCGYEVDNLYYFDGQELCIDCVEQSV